MLEPKYKIGDLLYIEKFKIYVVIESIIPYNIFNDKDYTVYVFEKNSHIMWGLCREYDKASTVRLATVIEKILYGRK
jgi:hypothetical protein